MNTPGSLRFGLALALCFFASTMLTGCMTMVLGYCVDTDEWVDVPDPQHVAVNEAGQLMLAVHIDRQLQSQRSGWHWITIDPSALQSTQTAIEGFDPEPIVLRWEGEQANARIDPPLLEAGLASPDPAAVGAVPSADYRIEILRRGWAFYLVHADDPARFRKLYAFEPGGQHYAPPIRHALHGMALKTVMAVEMAVYLPVVAVGYAAVSTVKHLCK